MLIVDKYINQIFSITKPVTQKKKKKERLKATKIIPNVEPTHG